MSKKKLDNLGISAFCESMAMMIQSGIQTDEAADLLLQEKKDSGILNQGLRVIRDEMEEGSALGAAMRKTGIFPEYALQMIDAAEMTGNLENILFKLSRYYAEQQTISEKLHNAVIYPASMLLLIIAVLSVMLAKVLPAFADVYTNLSGSLTTSAYRYIELANIFCWIVLVILILIAAALFGGLLLWNSGKRKLVEKILRHIPSCRRILDTMGMFRFTSALGTFLASGEMQDIAVLESMKMTDCKPVEEKLKRCVRRMEEGHSIAQAAYDEELFEPIYGRMLLAGERSGNLEGVLQHLTELLEENCSDLTDRLINFVDPMLSGVLMLTVGAALLSVMLPLIGIMNAVG